ncbi:MAG: Beta_propel domain protein [Candidatus Bathyarchaeota archaeon B23]|nr:MAG: Beta_propel domain protein [Candidatus Bathyarchaeota archaeon B23]
MMLLLAWCGLFYYGQSKPLEGERLLDRFDSYEELVEYLKLHEDSWSSYRPGFWRGPILLLEGEQAKEASTTEYSTTNVQVAGVDEADVVKTDGRYLYIASGCNVTILRAYPPEELEVLSTLSLNASVAGLYVYGDRLAILCSSPLFYPIPYGDVKAEIVPPIWWGETLIEVYDISDRESPRLLSRVRLDGDYLSSRMVEGYLYLVVNNPAVLLNESVVHLPRIMVDGEVIEVEAEEVYYHNETEGGSIFTTIASIDLLNPEASPQHVTFLLGIASELYASRRNLYIAIPEYLRASRGWWREWTSIHRVSFEGGGILYEAAGRVPGRVLDQFSMDEYEGHFRVATTSWMRDPTKRMRPMMVNNLYILNLDLEVVGRLEGLAPDEEIHSARFMGDRCYLVTYRQVDPLFALDLSDPEKPRVLGELKIPGYSDYLHPYGEGLLIGVGKEVIVEGDVAYERGVKVAIFNISDPTKPRETAKIELGGWGSDTPVRWEHKAFLLIEDRGLLVMPITISWMDWSSSKGFWQGAVVLSLSPGGIEVEGWITHMDGGRPPNPRWEVRRALYIGDYLYTISEGLVKVSSLLDLSEVAAVEIS